MTSPPNRLVEPFTPSSSLSQHEPATSRSPNPEAASFVPRQIHPQPPSYPLGTSQSMQSAPATQSASLPSSSHPNTRQGSATSRLHTSAPGMTTPTHALTGMRPVASQFFIPNPLNTALEQSNIQTAIIHNRFQAIERSLLRIEQGVGQQNTGTTNAGSWAGAVRAEDRFMELERTAASLGTAIRNMQGTLEEMVTSNREDLKDIIAVAVCTVLERVDTLHNEEKARLQERGDRYAHQNRILREQLRCKTARVKEHNRRNTATMAKSAGDSSDAPRPTPKKRVLRDSAVDMADESAGSAESTPKMTIGLQTVDESAQQVDGTGPLHQETDLGFDLGFLDSVNTSMVSDMKYLHHFMAQDQCDWAQTEVGGNGHFSSGETGFAYQMSTAPPFSSRPPEILKTGLDVSRGTFSSASMAPKFVTVAPTLAPPQPVTWDESIHWVEPVPFSTLAERQEAWMSEEFNSRHAIKPTILVEGLKYQPGVYATDVHRTVVISNLPVAISAGTLLRQVRGGNVYSVSMMDTSSILGSSSALVTFIHERSAVSFVQMAAVRPVVFGGKQAKVRLVKTPTYPTNRVLERGIFERGYTRVVVVENVQNPVHMEGIVKDLVAAQRTEDVVGWSAKDGDLVVHFMSVAAANRGYELIAQSPVHKELDLRWGKDPCDSQ